MIDWNATAAWIALVVTLIVSILAPLATAIMNNKHQLKMRTLEIKQDSYNEYFLKMRSVFEQFILCASKELTYSSSLEQVAEYLKNYYELFFYVPKDMWGRLEYLNQILRADPEEARKEFSSIVKDLAEILKTQEQLDL